MDNSISFGYARISTTAQNEARQVDALHKKGVADEHIFIDRISGKNFNRDSYAKLLRMMRRGDTLYITSIDRFGRDYKEITKEWKHITTEIGADIVVLNNPLLDTRGKRDILEQLKLDLVLKVASFSAQSELEQMKQRQAEGIALAKERGVYKGRKPIEIDKEAFEAAYGEVERGDRTSRWAMRTLGLKSNTYYKAVASYKNGWK